MPEKLTYKRCELCANEYAVEDLCFADDPVHEICNGCWRSSGAEVYNGRISPPDLSVDAHDGVGTTDGLA